jgi:hypothetical protein
MVTANDTLRRENQQLTEENRQLKAELLEIGSALGRLTGPGPRGRRGGGGVDLSALVEAAPRRQRKAITDPDALEKRRLALTKARAVRAERLAAARSSAAESVN